MTRTRVMTPGPETNTDFSSGQRVRDKKIVAPLLTQSASITLEIIAVKRNCLLYMSVATANALTGTAIA